MKRGESMMETLLTFTHLCILFPAKQLVCLWDCVKCVKYVQMKIIEKLNRPLYVVHSKCIIKDKDGKVLDD